MSVLETFSKRQKRLSGDTTEVYQYDSLSHPFRVQVVHIWNDCIGDKTQSFRHQVDGLYGAVVDVLRREYGVFQLGSSDGSYISELTNFFLTTHEADKALDIIELSFRLIDRTTRSFNYLTRDNAGQIADAGIAELNHRFREHALGYQFVDGDIIRVDSQFLHSEAVKPALALLAGPGFSGAQDEFLRAYEHYRHGQNKEALSNCLKAFESTMKSICNRRGWAYRPTDTAKALIEVLFANGLVPAFWQNQFSSLRSLLESSIPTGRNKLGGHGQGEVPVEVPDHLAAYMLHMTASTLVFLVAAEGELQAPKAGKLELGL